MDTGFGLDPAELPEELIPQIKPELVPGERLIWASRSGPDRPGSWPPVLNAALWLFGTGLITALALIGSAGGFGRFLSQAEGFLVIVAVVTAIAFLISLLASISYIGSALSARNLHQGQLYVLTDRRVILWKPNPESRGTEIHSFPRGSIKNASRVDYPDGLGDVTFYLTEAYPYGTPTSMSRIPNSREVEHYIRQALIVERGE